MKNFRRYMRVANRFPSILGVPENDELYVFVISLTETLEQLSDYDEEDYPVSFYISDVFRARGTENYAGNTFVLRRRAFSTDSMDFSMALRFRSIWVTPDSRPNIKENMKLGIKRNAILAGVEYHSISKACYGETIYNENFMYDMEIVHWPNPDLFHKSRK